MKQYQDLLREITETGTLTENRTGVKAAGSLGRILRFDLREGFPAVTTKKLFWKGVVAELVFFIHGLTDNNWLNEQGVHIWDEWAKENGDLGPVYGYQWRRFAKRYYDSSVNDLWVRRQHAHSERLSGYEDKLAAREYRHIDNTAGGSQGFDQLLWAENELRTNPGNRQIVVSAWNPLQIPQMALPPCHVLFQLRAINSGLHLTVYQRSCDMFLGVPFNIASYALLCHMLASTTGLEARELIWFGNDCHVYENHFEQVRELLGRKPRKLPRLKLRSRGSVVDFEVEDAKLEGYDPHPPIKAKVAV